MNNMVHSLVIGAIIVVFITSLKVEQPACFLQFEKFWPGLVVCPLLSATF